MAERAPRVFTDPAIEFAKKWLNEHRDKLHDYKGLCDTVNTAGFRTIQGTLYDHQQWQNKLNKSSGQLKTFLESIGFFKEEGPPKKRARNDAGPFGINQEEAEEDDYSDKDDDYADDEANDEKQEQQVILPKRLGTAPLRERELTREPFEFSDASRVQEILKTRNKISLLIGKTVSEKLGTTIVERPLAKSGDVVAIRVNVSRYPTDISELKRIANSIGDEYDGRTPGASVYAYYLSIPAGAEPNLHHDIVQHGGTLVGLTFWRQEESQLHETIMQDTHANQIILPPVGPIGNPYDPMHEQLIYPDSSRGQVQPTQTTTTPRMDQLLQQLLSEAAMYQAHTAAPSPSTLHELGENEQRRSRDQVNPHPKEKQEPPPGNSPP